MKKIIAAVLLSAAAGVACAAPVSQMIGDADGFGGAFPNLVFPQDHRSAAEASATNGAQQTDFYTALFSPLPQTFSMTFNFGGAVNNLSLDYRSFGLQASAFGPLSVTANGIDVSSLFNFEDGAFGDQTHGGAFGANVLAAINGAGNTLTLTLSRGGSNDAIAFDFFRVTGDASNSVPEPAGLALFGLAFLAAGAGRRKAANKA